MPEGRHEVPFSYTLAKTLPSSFEGEYGYIRYTCKATCERPWDFDISSKKAFTVVGIEDLNEDPKVEQQKKFNFEFAYLPKLINRK
ncbi:unnamed protein product [Anisakis simplex]|uniref:Arrestin-like N-terminal domain-containing protein n=1 Tax=Anisakis simplex TaxID=6269 RepID=A0A3P6R4F0_ANISI|nr:unnamed protein product [Anisakis simplex]